MRRRGFLLSLISIFGLTALSSLVYSAFRYLLPSEGVSLSSSIRLRREEVPSGRAKELLLNNKPVVVINIPGKGYVVLSRICTHLGCLVQYDSEKRLFVCPCHAGVYDLEGKVISGPPPRPLERIPVKVEGEEIIIG